MTQTHIRDVMFPKMREILSSSGKLNIKATAVDSFGISERLLLDQIHTVAEFSNSDAFKIESGYLISKQFEQRQSQDQL